MSRHSEDVDLVLLSTSSIISKNATTGVETALDVNELTALNNIAAADLAKIDGITNGTAASGKALVLGASGEIATITSATITTLTSTAVNATTVDATNVEVTNIKAKDGTASIVISDTTGAVAVPIASISTSLTFGAGSSFIADNGTATSTAAAATISKMSGVITTEALTTAANTDYTFTLTNTLVTANSNLLVTVGFGTATAGHPNVRKVTPGAGSAVIIIHNDDVAAALNGTIIIQFFLAKP